MYVSLLTCVARSTLIFEKFVKCTCSYFNLGIVVRPVDFVVISYSCFMNPQLIGVCVCTSPTTASVYCIVQFFIA